MESINVSDLSRPRRLAIIAALMLGNIMTFSSINIYISSIPFIINDLRISSSLAQGIISSFIIGTALGTLLFGPISDLFGRRATLLFGLINSSIVSLISLYLYEDIYYVILLRFLNGFFTSVVMSTTNPIIFDIYSGKKAEKVSGYINISIGILLAVLPVLGGKISLLFGWPLLFLLNFILTLSSTIAVYIILPETHIEDNRTPDISCIPSFIYKNSKRYANILLNAKGICYIISGLPPQIYYIVCTTTMAVMFKFSLNLDPETADILLSCFGSALFFSSFATVNLMKRYHNDQIILIADYLILTINIVLIVVTLFFHDEPIIITIAIFLLLLVSALVWTPSAVNFVKMFPNERGLASSLLACNMRLWSGAFAAVAGFIYDGTMLPLCFLITFVTLSIFLARRYLDTH